MAFSLPTVSPFKSSICVWKRRENQLICLLLLLNDLPVLFSKQANISDWVWRSILACLPWSGSSWDGHDLQPSPQSPVWSSVPWQPRLLSWATRRRELWPGPAGAELSKCGTRLNLRGSRSLPNWRQPCCWWEIRCTSKQGVFQMGAHGAVFVTLRMPV